MKDMGRALFLDQNQPKEKMVFLRVMNYRDSNAIFIVLVGGDAKDTGVPLISVTVRPDSGLEPFQGAISLENKDLAKMLIEHGICEPTERLVYSGFKALYVFAFHPEVLMEYDRQGTEQYKWQIDAYKKGNSLVSIKSTA